jgi:2-polyprenyl-6-methoxyphenol hydroxylase-like FAD-dependent oxidoreductase
MPNTESADRIIADSADYDAVVVGASLAGCTTAIQLGREGARVALVEKSPDPDAFKRICGHFIQASAAPTLERLELLEPILGAGGIRSRARAWTRWGWIDPAPEQAGYAVNLRREVLDPLIREIAASTPGVELMLGRTAKKLVREGRAVRGVVVDDRSGWETTLRARLVVGADGRGSPLAELAGLSGKTRPHARFSYAAYFEGRPDPPDTSLWFLDPNVAASFPTDSNLTLYAVVLTKDRLPEFKREPTEALASFIAGLPDPPPISSARPVGPVLGKIEMPNRIRGPVAPGLALVGDAALATDPLFGVGCGWAFESAEWLADSVALAMRGEEPLERGLARYRRRHRSELRGHAFLIHDYATGRRFTPFERMLFSAAARDPKVALAFDTLGTRQAKPGRILARTMPRVIAVTAKGAIQRHDNADPGTAGKPYSFVRNL